MENEQTVPQEFLLMLGVLNAALCSIFEMRVPLPVTGLQFSLTGQNDNIFRKYEITANFVPQELPIQGHIVLIRDSSREDFKNAAVSGILTFYETEYVLGGDLRNGFVNGVTFTRT